MVCPNCATTTKMEYKFCRSCGMNLEPVSRALAAHLSPGGAAAAAAAREAERRTVRRMTNGLLAGVGVVLLGVFMLSVLPGRAFRLMGVASALIGLVTALVSVLSPLRSMGHAGAEDAPPALDGAATAATVRLLRETTIEPAQSITDRTTELLGVRTDAPQPRE